MRCRWESQAFFPRATEPPTPFGAAPVPRPGEPVRLVVAITSAHGRYQGPAALRPKRSLWFGYDARRAYPPVGWFPRGVCRTTPTPAPVAGQAIERPVRSGSDQSGQEPHGARWARNLERDGATARFDIQAKPQEPAAASLRIDRGRDSAQQTGIDGIETPPEAIGEFMTLQRASDETREERVSPLLQLGRRQLTGDGQIWHPVLYQEERKGGGSLGDTRSSC